MKEEERKEEKQEDEEDEEEAGKRESYHMARKNESLLRRFQGSLTASFLSTYICLLFKHMDVSKKSKGKSSRDGEEPLPNCRSSEMKMLILDVVGLDMSALSSQMDLGTQHQGTLKIRFILSW